jgi:hypothetical protein
MQQEKVAAALWERDFADRNRRLASFRRFAIEHCAARFGQGVRDHEMILRHFES